MHHHYSDQATAVRRMRRQQAADGARDRSEPMSCDRARPTREQSGAIGRRKKLCPRITQRRHRG
jgi:hypothetical protein